MGANVSHNEFTSDRADARAEIVSAAKAMLEGKLSFIEGARQIFALSEKAGLGRDEDVLPFLALDDETDALPLGDVRRLWSSNGLERKQPDMDAAEHWGR